MKSNVRRQDNSCDYNPRKTTDKKRILFYQCRTCDPKSWLYLCPNCFKKGNHDGHKVTMGRFKHVAFCNCGDVTGKLSCSDHAHTELNTRPILYEKSLLVQFSKDFNIPRKNSNHINLARLNQLCFVKRYSDDWDMIENYFYNSNPHKLDMKLKRIWSVMRRDHEAQFVECGFDRDRRMLLWHGTRKEHLSNILLTGLEIPEGGVRYSGYYDGMFGRGIYFADRASKSAKYTDSKGTGLLLLCEVALGSMWRAGHPYPENDPPGHHDSVKGVGKNIPDRKGRSVYNGDIYVPSGTTIRNPKPFIKDTELRYNEFIVYEPERILIKFIVEIDKF